MYQPTNEVQPPQTIDFKSGRYTWLVSGNLSQEQARNIVENTQKTLNLTGTEVTTSASS